MVLAPVILLVGLLLAGGRVTPAEATPATPSATGSPWSSQEKTRLREIIAGVVQHESFLMAAVHAEFWQIMSKARPTSAQVEEVRIATVGAIVDYQRLFYEDALWALKSGRAFKSNQREQYENALVEFGVLTRFQVAQNERNIELIAARQPLPTGDVLDEAGAQAVLQSLAEVGARVDRLFTPP